MTPMASTALVSVSVEPLWEGADETTTRYTFPITEELACAVFDYVKGNLPKFLPPNCAADTDWSEGEYAYTSIYDPSHVYLGGVIAYNHTVEDGWQLAVSIPNAPEGDDRWDMDHADWRQPGPSHWMLVLAILKKVAPIELIRRGLRKPF